MAAYAAAMFLTAYFDTADRVQYGRRDFLRGTHGTRNSCENEDASNQEQAGSCSSGALDGYGLDFEIGGMDFGYGLPVGIALVLGDGFGSKLAKGSGYGMLAAEVSHLVSDLVSDMFDEDMEDEEFDPDEED